MTETVELRITAVDVRRNDVFTLHAHERTAMRDAWPMLHRGHVYIHFKGGGGATVPADRPITVRRAAEAPCATE